MRFLSLVNNNAGIEVKRFLLKSKVCNSTEYQKVSVGKLSIKFASRYKDFIKFSCPMMKVEMKFWESFKISNLGRSVKVKEISLISFAVKSIDSRFSQAKKTSAEIVWIKLELKLMENNFSQLKKVSLLMLLTCTSFKLKTCKLLKF